MAALLHRPPWYPWVVILQAHIGAATAVAVDLIVDSPILTPVDVAGSEAAWRGIEEHAILRVSAFAVYGEVLQRHPNLVGIGLKLGIEGPLLGPQEDGNCNAGQKAITNTAINSSTKVNPLGFQIISASGERTQRSCDDDGAQKAWPWTPSRLGDGLHPDSNR